MNEGQKSEVAIKEALLGQAHIQLLRQQGSPAQAAAGLLLWPSCGQRQ